MGTKENPGDFDCYANAAPDEPMFILLGRDPMAPTLARLWACLREMAGEDLAKVDEARRCATMMEEHLAKLKRVIVRDFSLDGRGEKLFRLVDYSRARVIEAAARAAHEANRAWCFANGDASQAPWDDAPDWQRASAVIGVEGVIAGNGPRESHACWLDEKRRTGWKYGPVKDPEKKEHPCFVPYEMLPPEQKAKDAIFVATVRSVLVAGGILS
jgi:hypothetical protein